MIVRPGRRMLVIATAMTGLGLFAFAWPPVLWILGVSLIVIAGLACEDGRRASMLINGIAATRTLPAIAGRDLEFKNSIRLKHDGSRSINGEIRDVFPAECHPEWWTRSFQLPAGETSTDLAVVCRIPRRGHYRFGPLWVRVPGPWELIEVQRQLELPGEIKILPETFVSPDALQKDARSELLQLDKLSRIRQYGTGTEFVMLDEYRQGDDPRRIDWRSTARHRHPIVRRYQVERHRDVIILIDSGRLMGAMTDRGSKLDCAVDSALNLARAVLESGDRCGIGYFDNVLRGYLPPTAGPKSLRRLVECVYALQTQWQESNYSRLFGELQHRQSKRSLLVILSDLGDAETSRMHCAAIERLNRRHLVLLAALRTPLITRVIRRETTSVQEGAQQAVAMGLSRDRGRALHALKHGGVRVLDLDPQQVTVPLINRYVELRRQNQL